MQANSSHGRRNPTRFSLSREVSFVPFPSPPHRDGAVVLYRCTCLRQTDRSDTQIGTGWSSVTVSGRGAGMASLCLQEVVISGSPEDETMHLWELNTATTLVSYRPASPSCFAAAVPVGRDLFAVSQPGKPALHVFNWRRDMPQARMSLPERLVALAASPDGAHVLGGGEGGRVFLWEVAGGAMLRTWEAHYRAVTAIVFTDDGSHIITASEDSLVPPLKTHHTSRASLGPNRSSHSRIGARSQH